MSLETHFVKNGNGTFRIFALATCAKCGQDCEVNGVTACEPASKLQRLGLKRHPVALEELGYSEKFGDAVCPDCYAKIEKPLD